MLSKKEMNFLLDVLKQLLSKMGGESAVQRTFRKRNVARKPRPTDDELVARRLLFMSSGRNPITDYSRPKVPIAG